MAAMAPARSTRCMTLPPRTLPSPLASFGSANSEYSETDSRTNLPCIMLSRYHAAHVGVARFGPARLLTIDHGVSQSGYSRLSGGAASVHTCPPGRDVARHGVE